MLQSNDKTSKPRSATKRRKRRSTQEIIDRIIDAAVLEFGENGYSSTTTAAIARRADVAEALIFTNFGTKANLFRKAVFKPLDDHFSNFIDTHVVDDDDDASLERESREFVSDLVAFVRRHAPMFKSLVVNQAYSPDDEGSGGLRGLQDYFDKMSSLELARLSKSPKVAPRLMSRLSFSAILGCILFNDWMFPDGLADEDEIHEALCDFIMDGINVNFDIRRQRVRNG